MLLADEEVEYNDHFDLYMTRMEYLDFPRSIYSRVCFINWNDSHYDTNERRQNIEEAIRFKERAKKEKQLIELENLLLESLSSSEVSSTNFVGLFSLSLSLSLTPGSMLLQPGFEIVFSHNSITLSLPLSQFLFLYHPHFLLSHFSLYNNIPFFTG